LADKFDHLIISTGMHTIREIEQAINFLQKENINATLLHTVSIYPTPLTKAYMHKFLWLKEHYPKVGYSNHVPSVEPVKFAILHNATFIEVHMKLGFYGPGRTTDFDLNINEVEEIVKYRNILQEMLGDIKNLNDKDFLYDEEKTARKRFIGRWGNNR
jgi:N-acetylneuraminate synthase